MRGTVRANVRARARVKARAKARVEVRAKARAKVRAGAKNWASGSANVRVAAGPRGDMANMGKKKKPVQYVIHRILHQYRPI